MKNYDVYEIYIRHLSTNSNVSYFYTRFIDSAGNTISDAEYDYAGLDMHCEIQLLEKEEIQDKHLWKLIYVGPMRKLSANGWISINSI
jgi:hypothetical protein